MGLNRSKFIVECNAVIKSLKNLLKSHTPARRIELGSPPSKAGALPLSYRDINIFKPLKNAVDVLFTLLCGRILRGQGPGLGLQGVPRFARHRSQQIVKCMTQSMVAIQFVSFSAMRSAVPLAPQALGPDPLILRTPELIMVRAVVQGPPEFSKIRFREGNLMG